MVLMETRMTARQGKKGMTVGSVSTGCLKGSGGYDLVKGLTRSFWCIGQKS